MTTTNDHPNYVRVAPRRGVDGQPVGSPANGKSSKPETADDERHAQARARARDGLSVTAALGAVREHRRRRAAQLRGSVAAVLDGDREPTDVGDQPDAFRRRLPSLEELWIEACADVGSRWRDGRRLAAVAYLLVFVLPIGAPLTGVGYLLAFCGRKPWRAVWLAVFVACLFVLL